MVKMYSVSLTEAERLLLRHTVSRGKASARTLTRARILLKADEGADGPGKSDAVIATTLDVGVRSVERLRQRAVTESVAAALQDRPRSGQKPCTLDGAQEARLTALACSQPPSGQGRWSLRLLATEFGKREDGATVSHELVRRTLKKTSSSLI
jgi:transposase